MRGVDSESASYAHRPLLQTGLTGLVGASVCVGYRLTPEAAIVNLYRRGQSTHMGGHQDDLELTMDAPVVSISVGNTAIFLLGW